MAAFGQSVADNLQYLQKQINRSATAPMGPVALTPGEGHIRMNNGTHDTGFLDFNGQQIRYRGGLRGLTELNESFALSIEGHTNLLAEHVSTLAQHNTRINANDQKRIDGDAALQSDLDSKVLSLSGQINSNDASSRARDDALSTRVTAAHSLAEGRATQAQILSLSGQINTNDANSRDRDTALSGRVTTAQSRAETAVTLAGNARDDAAALRTQVRNWIAQARLDNPSLPPNIPA